MLKIGCHLSSAKGYLAMGQAAISIGANTFQFFTRNPRGGRAKELSLPDVQAYHAFAVEHGLGPVLAHAPYTLNAASPEPRLQTFARETMLDDFSRLEYMPGSFYNFHPGSNKDSSSGIGRIADLLNEVLPSAGSTTVLLETMAGKGNEIGRTFQQLGEILDQVVLREKIGICIDTCHVWDGGYDIANDLDGVLTEFDEVIGREKLYAIHLNDSLNPLGSRKDRHGKIGGGVIGIDALGRVINHPHLQGLSFYLETPNDLLGHGEEIALLRTMYHGK